MLTAKSLPCESCKTGRVPTPIGYQVNRCVQCGDALAAPIVPEWLRQLEQNASEGNCDAAAKRAGIKQENPDAP